MIRTILFAAAATVAMSSAASATVNNGNNNCQGNCPNTGTPSTVNNTPTFNNDPRATASVVAPVTNVVAPVTTSGAQAGALAGALSESASQSASSSSASLTGKVTGSVDASITNAPVVAPVFNGPAVSITTPKQYRNAPDVGAPLAINVASCAMADGFSLSVPGGGGSVNKSKVDDSCNTRADAALLFSFGEREAAVARMYGHDNAGAINIGRGLNADGSPRN